jgi:sugar O-acyltransferase (sialic acid O-acetyltransferase NeuD family)
MSDLVLFGAGDIAELADFYFQRDSPHRVVAFTVDGAYVREPTFKGRPVVAFESVQKEFPPERHAMFVAVSYSDLNRLRAAKCLAAEQKGYRLESYVSSRATVWADVGACKNLFIFEDNTVQPFVRIGHHVTMWSGNHVGHHSTIEDDVFISSHVVISGGCTIGRNSFLGVNATLRDHVRIGPYTVLGAGALVVKDTEEASLMLSPAVAKKSDKPSTSLPRI